MNDGADAIVVGGGTAGSVVAARLVESGRQVLVLEAGPDYGSFGGLGWPSDLLDASTIPTSHDWNLRSGAELAGRDLAYERARVIGGCSAHNGCTASWGHRLDYDGWAALDLPGWGADALLPWFREASLRMRVRRFTDDEIAPLHRAFIEAGAALGLPTIDDLESLDGVPSVCTQPSNSPDGVRWNAAFAYLDPVRDRDDLEIHGLARVDRILFEGTRAVGVTYEREGAIVEAWADLVVLAGGTYGSPQVLLQSGVGPAEELWDLGIPIVADVPGVGQNLHDHPSFELTFEPTEELTNATEAFAASGNRVPDEQAFAKAASSGSPGGIFDLHVFPEIAMNGRLAIFAAYLTPRSRGSLTLRTARPGDAPHIDHAYLSDEEGHDLMALTDGVQLARAFAASSPMRSVLGPEVSPGPDSGAPDALRTAIREGVIHYWHPVGTCAMGPDHDSAAVTDADGRVRGVEGLVVADASLMPATVRATTNLPTVVIGERIASALVEVGRNPSATLRP